MSTSIFALVLTLFATAACHKSFHCQFKNEFFQVERTPENSGPYVWGDNVPPLSVPNRALLMEKIHLEKFKLEIYKDHVFDNFGSYIRTYDAMKNLRGFSFVTEDVKNRTLVDEFGENYQFTASYDRRDKYTDSLVLTLNFLRDYPTGSNYSLINHFFLGVAGGTPTDVVMVKNQTYDSPTELLADERVVGLIKVSRFGKMGYIIIDLETPGDGMPLVMENDAPIREIYYRLDKLIKYQLIGRSKNFIEVVTFRYDDIRDLYVRDMSSLIHVGRPLCSFVETNVRRTLLHTSTLSLVKYFGVNYDYLIGAYLYADLNPEKMSDRFRLGHIMNHEGAWTYDQLGFVDWETVASNPKHKEVLDAVVENFDLSKEELKKKILNFEKFDEEIKLPPKATVKHFDLPREGPKWKPLNFEKLDEEINHPHKDFDQESHRTENYVHITGGATEENPLYSEKLNEEINHPPKDIYELAHAGAQHLERPIEHRQGNHGKFDEEYAPYVAPQTNFALQLINWGLQFLARIAALCGKRND